MLFQAIILSYGVPISFLDKYSPEQFEIVGMAEDNGKDSGGIWMGKSLCHKWKK